MTEKAQDEKRSKSLGTRLTTVGSVLVALSILLALVGLLGGTASNVMVAVGVVLGVTGMVMTRMEKKKKAAQGTS